MLKARFRLLNGRNENGLFWLQENCIEKLKTVKSNFFLIWAEFVNLIRYTYAQSFFTNTHVVFGSGEVLGLGMV